MHFFVLNLCNSDPNQIFIFSLQLIFRGEKNLSKNLVGDRVEGLEKEI